MRALTRARVTIMSKVVILPDHSGTRALMSGILRTSFVSPGFMTEGREGEVATFYAGDAYRPVAGAARRRDGQETLRMALMDASALPQ
jgi:hypothetical protein